ncbi:MAG TPA: hypothetical protein VN925_04085, partial [Steroidobacteraceae bacterium]|nr:hypothetical protein [Steroidobacteraceae bacterium]
RQAAGGGQAGRRLASGGAGEQHRAASRACASSTAAGCTASAIFTAGPGSRSGCGAAGLDRAAMQPGGTRVGALTTRLLEFSTARKAWQLSVAALTINLKIYL